MTTKQKGLRIVPLQSISAVLAWRDLSQRTDDEVRANKRAWRVFIWMNTGNAVVYWLLRPPPITR